MLCMPALLASITPISNGKCPANEMFCFLLSSATAKKASREGIEMIFMKLAPRFLSSSTAAAGLVNVRDGVLFRCFPAARGEKRACGDDVRPEHRPGLYVVLPGEESVKIAAHVAHAGNSVGQKQWEKNLFAPGRIGVDACKMDMHVPKTGKKELSGGINGAGGFGNLDS